ncbi:MAG TPA: sodium-dependent transporter [Gemmatimonadetes bacterium]|jgi:NSS family neurotransmitter:Na+ symporter|nr:sodium-dependent transporter [Gemmatimonadota bacterium]
MKDRRENWSSNFGFILAATGSAIGLGNLWKFPFITWKNDGGAFVLIYLICIIAVGLPIMMAELLVGRKTQKSAVGALREAIGPAWGWVGTWGVMAGFVILSYYAVVAGWSLFYLFQTLNWSFFGFPTQANMGGLFAGLAANGLLQTTLSGTFMLLTVAVVFFGVHGGIERTARLCLPALFVIMLLLLFSALSMEGSGEALNFIFRPNFSELDTAAILEALGHAFFTLSLGMGTMIVYGSYVARERSLVNAAGSIVILDTVIALIATIIMFSVIFTVPGMPEQVDGSSVGMLFISLPQLFYEVVPFGVVLAPAFYLLVALAALTSTISLLEVVVSYFIDQRKMERSRATLLSGACIYIFTFLSGLSFGAFPWLSNFELFDGKAGFFATMDHFASNWALPLGGLLITLGVGWFMPSSDTEAELVGSGSPGWFSHKAWLFAVRFIAPAAVAAILIAVIFFGKDFS